MADLGKKIRVVTVPEPIRAPSYMPTRKENPVQVPQVERDLIPVRKETNQ